MCMKIPKPKAQPKLPGPPAPPAEMPKPMVKNETPSVTDSKRKGRTSLRIDLNPAVSSGLRL